MTTDSENGHLPATPLEIELTDRQRAAHKFGSGVQRRRCNRLAACGRKSQGARRGNRTRTARATCSRNPYNAASGPEGSRLWYAHPNKSLKMLTDAVWEDYGNEGDCPVERYPEFRQLDDLISTTAWGADAREEFFRRWAIVEKATTKRFEVNSFAELAHLA